MKKLHVWEARLLRVFSMLPLSIVVGLATLLARLFVCFPLSVATPHRSALINTLICFPEKDWAAARRFARQSVIETARTLAGYSHVWLRPPEETLARVKKVHGMEAWQEAIRSDRPVLYLSLHQSSWEVPVLLVGRHDPGALIMYQPVEGSALEDLVKDGREATGCTLIPTNGEGVRAALIGLEKGKSMALLADHEPGGRTNPFVPFFGQDVMVPSFIYKVIKRFQPHVFFISAQRSDDYRYEIWLDQADPAMLAMSEHDTLRAMTAGFETIIRRNPVQYQWTYKRFRRGVRGARGWYKPAALKRLQAGESPASVFVEPQPVATDD
ncbi:MAG: lipid A biosynthesis acyltransferase [Alcanivoracaceae bacterium]|jgi:KDO2-lipid IV(A) lauroyltransferase|nr:lipid A biosynthesis acyltransferase [Alcanivoracaceae bacterium]